MDLMVKEVMAVPEEVEPVVKVEQVMTSISITPLTKVQTMMYLILVWLEMKYLRVVQVESEGLAQMLMLG